MEKNRGPSMKSDRELIELAKTMGLDAIAKKMGRKPMGILKTAKRLGLSIKGSKTMIKRTRHIWFVSYKRVGSIRESARQAETFASELEAKNFARARIDDKNMYAGTINPCRPKRTVSSHQIADWLDEEE
jgi:hypothetical protein